MPEDERFGIWLMIERDTDTVVGDIGFMGPPDDGSVEIGFSVIPDRRRLGYASEAAGRLVAWALEQPEISARSSRGPTPTTTRRPGACLPPACDPVVVGVRVACARPGPG